MKTLIFVTIITKRKGYSFSQAKLHSAWDNKADTIEECKRLKAKGLDSFFTEEYHNYTNGQKFINL